MNLVLVYTWGMSLICMLSPVLVYPAFLPHLPPTTRARSCSLCSSVQTSWFPLCPFPSPELPALYSSSGSLQHCGASCLLTSPGCCLMGMLFSGRPRVFPGVAGWSPPCRLTLPGHILITPLSLLFCTLRTFYE